jgi:hypothetical protein
MIVEPQTHPMVKLSPSSFAFGGKSRPTAPAARRGNINALAQAVAKRVVLGSGVDSEEGGVSQ